MDLKLAGFLNDMPPEWSQVVSTRAALRVLPIALTAGLPESVWLPVFRACFVSWAVSRLPTSDLRSAAQYAVLSANRSAGSVGGAMGLSARAAAYAAQSIDRVEGIAIDCIVAATGAVAAFNNSDAESIIQHHLSIDLAWLSAAPDRLPEDLAVQNLWYDDPPHWAQQSWTSFLKNLRALEKKFEPWLNWYLALFIANGPSADYFGPDLTLRIAEQSDGWWHRPAAQVNSDITAWLKQRNQAVLDDAQAKSNNLEKLFDKTPPQGPGPYRYATRNDRIYVLPPMNVDDPQGFAEDYRTEAQEKAEELLERLNRSNADPQAARAVSRLLETLRPTLSEIRPALLDSRTLSVTAIADAFDNPRDEPELFAGAIAQLRDLGLTARRLCLCFPELRDIESDAMAFGLRPEDVPTVLAATADIADAAKQSPLLEAETVVALDTVQEEAAQPGPEPVQRKRAAMAAQNVRNLLIEVISAVRRTGVAAGGIAWRFAKDTAETARPLLVQGSAYALVLAAATLAGEVLGPMYQLAMLAGGFKEIKDVLAAIKDLFKPTDPT